MIRGKIRTGGERYTLLAETAITTAVTGTTTTPVVDLTGMFYCLAQIVFDYGSGGTSAKFYIQTSIDGAVTWRDIICFALTTSDRTAQAAVNVWIALAANQANQDAALSDNTILNGLLGDRLRVKYTTTGTYVATTAKIDVVVKG